MSDTTPSPGAPSAFDVVEIINPQSATRVSAVVESASKHRLVLLLDHATGLPEDAPVRWHDGAASWQALSRFEPLDEMRVSCQLTASAGWEPAPPRASLRVLTDNSPLLIRIVESNDFPRGRRIYALCVDVSDTDCRVSWPGPAPSENDVVEIAWERGDWRTNAEPAWVPARVERVLPRPFETRHVCLTFETADTAHAASVRKWFLGWLRHPRLRTRNSS
ncbi:MAG: hypothetical protein QOK36_53 [Gaiellales bacterium]|nr:hypothetical protein [Gaiellales bacterium]